MGTENKGDATQFICSPDTMNDKSTLKENNGSSYKLMMQISKIK